LATFLAGKPLADELPSAAASATMGITPPVIPSASEAYPWTRLELLVPVDQLFSIPDAFFPRRAKNLIGRISKVLRVSL
jgi:hypothetical protein